MNEFSLLRNNRQNPNHYKEGKIHLKIFKR